MSTDVGDPNDPAFLKGKLEAADEMIESLRDSNREKNVALITIVHLLSTCTDYTEIEEAYEIAKKAFDGEPVDHSDDEQTSGKRRSNPGRSGPPRPRSGLA